MHILRGRNIKTFNIYYVYDFLLGNIHESEGLFNAGSRLYPKSMLGTQSRFRLLVK